MRLLQLVPGTEDPFSASLWTKAVVTALHNAGLDSVHATLVSDLHALDRLCHQWWGRYGGGAHTQRPTEADDHTSLLVPLVEKLTMLHAAVADWGLPHALLRVHEDKKDTFHLDRQRLSGDAVGQKESAEVVDTPLMVAAALLADDASRNWRAAAFSMQQLTPLGPSNARPSAAVVHSRAKDSYKLFQAAYAGANAVLALPLTHGGVIHDATALRDACGACAAAVQYIFAAAREGAASEQHNLLASLAANAAHVCGSCRRQDDAWETVLGSTLNAASLLHRAEGLLRASEKDPRVVPQMGLALGYLMEARRLMGDVLSSTPAGAAAAPAGATPGKAKLDAVGGTHTTTGAAAALLRSVFPIAHGLQADVEALYTKAERENRLVYLESPVPPHQFAALDVEKHSSSAPTGLAFYTRTVAWRDAFRGPTSTLHKKEENAFLRYGPSPTDVHPLRSEAANNSKTANSGNDSGEDDDDNDSAFGDAESPEEAAIRFYQVEVPSAIAAVAFDNEQSFALAAQYTLAAIAGFSDVLTGAPRVVASKGGDEPTVPWWLAAIGDALNKQLIALRRDLSDLHEERKKFITANVADPLPGLAAVEDALRLWFREARRLMSVRCTLLPARECELSAIAAAFVDHSVVSKGTLLLTTPEDLRRLLLASADSDWARLLHTSAVQRDHDVSPAQIASLSSSLRTLRTAWEASPVSTTELSSHLKALFVEADRIRRDMGHRLMQCQDELGVVRNRQAEAVAAPGGGGVRVGSRLKAMLDHKRQRGE